MSVASPGDPLLRVEHLDVAYGDVQVLWDVNLEVRAGEMVALVGSNGAGKSTLLSALSGLIRPKGGTITFDGERIERASTQRIVDLGIAHVPEGRRLFPYMAVNDQLLLGAFRRKNRAAIRQDLDYVLTLFPRVAERRTALAGTRSGGEQQMAAIARALMARPRLLMIDELSLGLAPVLVEDLLEKLEQIHREGMTLLIVEQDVQTALEQADRGYVLETGQITLHGRASDLLGDDRVRQAYLGV